MKAVTAALGPSTRPICRDDSSCIAELTARRRRVMRRALPQSKVVRPWMSVIVHRPGPPFRPWEDTAHEIVVELCRVVRHRCRVCRVAQQPSRIASSNRLRCHAAPGHGRCTEAGGKATPGGAWHRHTDVPPDVVDHARVDISRADSVAGARHRVGQDCEVRESREQLQRRLRIQHATRQGSLGRL